MKRFTIYYDKKWFAFPFCIMVSDCIVRDDYRKQLTLHILWLHFRWFICKGN